MFLLLICLEMSGKGEREGDFKFLLFGASAGAFFLVSANDFILLFVALETLALGSIAIVGSRDKAAAIKYLINNGVASVFLLFALALIYGFSAKEVVDPSVIGTNFSAVRNFVIQNGNSFASIFPFVTFHLALVMMAGAIAFKLSLVPFHSWTADAYKGACLRGTAFLSGISKIASIGLFLHITWAIFPVLSVILTNDSNAIATGKAFSVLSPIESWLLLFGCFAVMSMWVGNLLGAREFVRGRFASMKGLLAYSSIAQSGYVMAAMALDPITSLKTGIFFLVIYNLLNLALFLGLIQLERITPDNINPDSFLALEGLWKVKPKLTLFLSTCLLGLAGVLPSMLLPKMLLVESVLQRGIVSQMLPEMQMQVPWNFVSPLMSICLALSIIFSSLIGVFFYFGLIQKMFSPKEDLLPAFRSTPRTKVSWILACVILIGASFMLALYPGFWLEKISAKGARSAFVNSQQMSKQAIPIYKGG